MTQEHSSEIASNANIQLGDSELKQLLDSVYADIIKTYPALNPATPSPSTVSVENQIAQTEATIFDELWQEKMLTAKSAINAVNTEIKNFRNDKPVNWGTLVNNLTKISDLLGAQAKPSNMPGANERTSKRLSIGFWAIQSQATFRTDSVEQTLNKKQPLSMRLLQAIGACQKKQQIQENYKQLRKSC